MDQWAPADFMLVSPFAFEWLAAFLNGIEGGKKLPAMFNHGRAAFLAESEEENMDPMEHRVLVMLPSVYWLWGKVWLRHLEPWVGKWAMDEFYAGVSGQGAQDAADATAVLMANIQLKGENLIGGAADIYKCFDQVLRPLIYILLIEAGLPQGLIEAYKDMLG